MQDAYWDGGTGGSLGCDVPQTGFGFHRQYLGDAGRIVPEIQAPTGTKVDRDTSEPIEHFVPVCADASFVH
jgi:hypothetical protein